MIAVMEIKFMTIILIKFSIKMVMKVEQTQYVSLDIVRALGTRTLPQKLMELTTIHGASLPYYTVALRFNFNHHKKIESVTPLFTFGELDPVIANRGMNLYCKDRQWRYDHLTRYIKKTVSTETVSLSEIYIPESEYGRVLVKACLASECTIIGVHKKQAYVYSCFYKSDDNVDTSAFKLLSDTIATIIMKHDRLLSSTYGKRSPVDFFRYKLDYSGVKLSTQETQTCLFLLQGLSISDAASHMNVKECTVRTYLHRALRKLSLNKVTQLYSWGWDENLLMPYI